MEKVKLELEFAIGTIEELGYGGLKQPWIDAEAQGNDGKYALYCGAGLGNWLLEASGERDGQHLYAQADIRPLATAIFIELGVRLGAAQQDPAR